MKGLSKLCRHTHTTVNCYFSQLCRHQDYWTWHKLIIFLEGKRDASQKDEPQSARASLSWSTKGQVVQSHLQRSVQCIATVWRCLKGSTENKHLLAACTEPLLSIHQAKHTQGKEEMQRLKERMMGGKQQKGALVHATRHLLPLPAKWNTPAPTDQVLLLLLSLCFAVCPHSAFEAVHQDLQHRRFAFFTRIKNYLEARRRKSWGMS